MASGGEEFNPGPETRLDRSELLYKRDREASDINIRRGQKANLLVLAKELYTFYLVLQ